jgi:hypothetical protein
MIKKPYIVAKAVGAGDTQWLYRFNSRRIAILVIKWLRFWQPEYDKGYYLLGRETNSSINYTTI